jgi:uracil-DNA glycosylase
MQVKIHPSWQTVLQSEFDKPYFENLVAKVKSEYATTTVFPLPQNIFRAFDLVPFDAVRVVILGQDPYHTPQVADGLAFSTNLGNKLPPSLQNVYKEITSEFGQQKIENTKNPDLTRWANQGVLLLNTCLTVRQGEANSHSKYGWSSFTDRVIEVVASQNHNTVFVLWGANARAKKKIIEPFEVINNLLVLESAHPSPLSAHNGFFGNNHFQLCNQFLEKNSLAPIDW